MSGPEWTENQKRALVTDASISVRAGAGSGKTTVLVERYLRLVSASASRPKLAPSEILAITFTRKAAAQMRARLLEAIRNRGLERERPELVHEVLAAPISTIHAWAADLLREHALDCGIDPGFEVLEETEARALFERALTGLLDAWARGDDAWGAEVDALARFFKRRRKLAEVLEALYTTKRARALRWARSILQESEDPHALIARWAAATPAGLDPRPVIAKRLRPAIERLAALGAATAPEDKLMVAVRALEVVCGRIEAAPDAATARARLRRVPRKWQGTLFTKSAKPCSIKGTKNNWKGREDDHERARALINKALATLHELCGSVVADLDARMVEPLRGLAALLLALDERYREAKRLSAALDFDDLIETAARLVTGGFGERAAAAACRPYRAVLVDEFQDVDEWQAKIVRALASYTDTGERSLAGGRLFIVGDDKQSIYRFRGADVSVFRELGAEIVRAEGDELRASVLLSDCFRTLPAPLALINASFEKLFAAGAERREPFEPEPANLVNGRKRLEGDAGSVELLLTKKSRAEQDEHAGAEAIDEAELVARYLRRRLDEGKTRVYEKDADKNLRRRPLEPRDVAILLRTRTRLKRYEAALLAHGIPFSVHGGIGFWAAEEVRDALHLLKVLADPEDDLALAALLRSPFALVPDEALFAVARSNRGASLWERLERLASGSGDEVPWLHASAQAALVRAWRLVSEWRARAHEGSAAALLRDAIERSGALGAYVAGPRGERAEANLEKLLDRVRRFERHALHGLGELVERLEQLSDRDEREAEAELEEANEAASGVRIMTVHAAKGLEFPLVIVPECGAKPSEQDLQLGVLMEELGARDADGFPHYEVALKVPDPFLSGKPGEPGLYAALKARTKKKAAAESRRLLYVALTRARDHLVLAATVNRNGKPTGGSWLSELADAWGIGDPANAFSGERLVIEGRDDRLEAPIVHAEALIDTLPPERARMRAARTEELRSALPPRDDSLQTAADSRGVAAEPEPLLAVPARPFLSPSRWKLYRGCPRRYAYRVVLGLEEPAVSAAARGIDPALAMKRGTAIHRLFELGLLERAGLEGAIERTLEELGASGDQALREEVERAAKRAIERYENSLLRAEIAAARMRWPEAPFAMRLGDGEIEGTIDLLCRRADGTILIVDWKTDRMEARDPSELEAYVETSGYGLQLDLYAFAASRLLELDLNNESATPAVAACLFFTWSGACYRRSYRQEDLDAVGERAARDLAWIARGRFERGEHPPCAQCGFSTPAEHPVCPSARRFSKA